MIKIIVLIVAILLIAFIIWWFFGKHAENAGTATIVDNKQHANIIVNGGYNPTVLTLKAGIPTTITFNRKDPSTCLEKVVFPDFGINQELPQNKDVTFTIDTSKTGEFNYACGMNMFHGKLIIK
ncbi:cupredoxin domain-containing protein [Ligilactobacillus sp. WILCCON 0076]|uniref:Cupredoxin domain-containing protein n=1 Tax=Ligilactobacillus ubinensis TaxID=2876789 RepID=A0A9X2FFT0_9LACO|nr:cupredoxin domain-containing protein [Ligilactobacillus ubinensis]MCP0885757.1 cupredoxin domain-containing protein [Ligilactobacillus ubinensis]